jgi:predicted permease
MHDVRYGLRMLAKKPGFTTAAVVTLALGIGANTAIFSLLNAVMLRKLPVRQPDQLVELFTRDRSGRTGQLSFPLFEEIERRQRVFSGMFAWWGDGVFNVEANGVLSQGDIYAVTGDFYSELGVTPLLGRLLTPADVNLHGGSPAAVAVLGCGFWQRYYGGDATVLGKTVRIEGIPFTVVGVTRQGFRGMGLASAPDVTIPLFTRLRGGKPEKLYTSASFWVGATGRLKNGVTLAQARAQIGSFWQAALEETLPSDYNAQQRAEYLGTNPDPESAANGIDWFLRAHFTRPLYFLAGIAGLILLIACVNLASLMLARAAGRTHEMGVRVALGASGGRLARQLLTESVLLSALGAAVGFVLACWGSVALKNFVTRGYLVPSALNVNPDLRVLGFTAALAILTGILFGLAPVWQLARRSPAGVLQEDSRRLGNPPGRFGKGLISIQVALSLVLLMAAGLFIRSLEKLNSVDPGFQTQSVLDIQLFARPHGYENLDNLSYYSELLGRVSRLPGVAGAALSHFRPAGGYEWQEPVSASSSPTGPGTQAGLAWVSPGFFETLGIRLLSGRDFNWQDNAHSPRVATLSQSLAGRLFPSGDAIGRRINIGAEPEWQNVEVVGIVTDTHLYDVRSGNTSTVYVDALQAEDFAHWSSLEVRAMGNPMGVAAAARNAVDGLGHEYVLMMRTLAQVKDQALLNERLTAMLSELFGGLALLLVATGLYGLMAYNVAQRTREMGIRMALGAPQASILWMVLRETLILIIIGLGIGIPCALMAAKLIAHMLFGLSPHDPLTLGAVLLALILATAVAGYIPARRATKVDPMVALRYE